jgi:hypothetical protein
MYVSWKLDSLSQSVEVSSFRLKVVQGGWLLTGFASRRSVGTGQDLTASISDLSVSASWFWLGDFSILMILWSVNLEMRRRGEEEKKSEENTHLECLSWKRPGESSAWAHRRNFCGDSCILIRRNIRVSGGDRQSLLGTTWQRLAMVGSETRVFWWTFLTNIPTISIISRLFS